MRLGKCRRTGKPVRHLLDAASRSHKLACRSSLGPELLEACRAVDGLQARLLTLRETVHGPASTEEIRGLREERGHAIPADLVIDGTSVFSALLMDPVWPPSENRMVGHLRRLNDQLRTEQIDDLH
eukprot:3138121-Pyramimonas_sp.AAC.1